MYVNARNRIGYAYKVIVLSRNEWWDPIGEWHEAWDPYMGTHVSSYQSGREFSARMEGEFYQATYNHGELKEIENRMFNVINNDNVAMFNVHMIRISELSSYFEEELAKLSSMMVAIQIKNGSNA